MNILRTLLALEMRDAVIRIYRVEKAKNTTNIELSSDLGRLSVLLVGPGSSQVTPIVVCIYSVKY